MSDLDFIEDTELRKTLDNSIEYIYALFEQSKAKEENKLYQEETYRVIILYVVSAIEAVLLYYPSAEYPAACRGDEGGARIITLLNMSALCADPLSADLTGSTTAR